MSWLRAAGRRIGRKILTDPRLGPLFQADVFGSPPPGRSAAIAATAPAARQAASASIAAPAAIVVLVRLRLVRPVQASLALTRPVQASLTFARLVVAHLAIEGKRMSVSTLTAGSAALIMVTFLTEGGAPITDAGGVVLRAKPPGAGAVRTYNVTPGDSPGEWRGTILFDVPGRWWVEGLCATPSPEVSAPLVVEVRAAAAA